MDAVRAGRTVDRRALGQAGEEAALRAYVGRGFRLVARNWRCPLGELDLVVERGDLLVFCEVKTRSGSRFGGGFEAVTAVKQRRLRRLAEAFLAARRTGPVRIRFDVASVHAGRRSPDVVLFEDAF